MQTSTNSSGYDYDLKGAVVLIADDDPIIRKIFSKYLAKWNASVDVVFNGLEALRSVQEKVYDLVIMDVEMPGMTGFEATASIRQLEGDYFKTLPVLAMSACRFCDVRSEVASSGMNGFIDKIFEPADLYGKVESHLERKIAACGA